MAPPGEAEARLPPAGECVLERGRAEGAEMDETRDGSCHCGAVRFRVRLSGGLGSARRCTCSYCRMRGAVALSARLEDFELLAGEDKLALYRFNTMTARHHFCSVCGIYTHHQRRSNPEQYGVNAAALGISPFDFAEVPVVDGENHPADDAAGASREVGVLRFVPRPATA
jgi:hypothetical protein